VVAVAALVVSSLSGAGIDTRWTAGGGELGWRFRAKGPAGSTGLLAELCLVPFVVAVAERRRKLAALFGAVIALSVTRTILAALVALLVLERPRAWKPLVALLGLAALASIYVDIHQLGTPGIRWRIAASAASTALHHPILGVGPNAPPAWAAWPGPRDPVGPWDAHSTVLDLAATLGLPALLAFAALVIVALAGVAEDPLTAALQVALWATVFDAVTIDVEDFRHVWLLLGLVTAGTRALRRPPRPPSAAIIPETF
jgi:O-antigen ligase